jgi:small GTP-binding protein
MNFIEDPDSTIGLDMHTHKLSTGTKKCNAKIWDTSGQAMFRDTIRTQYRAADCILFVFDVSRPESLQMLEPYIQDAKAAQGNRPCEYILVANKIDLRQRLAEEEPLISKTVTAEETSDFVELHGLSDYREVSARTGANVKLTFNRTLAHAAFRSKSKGGLNLNSKQTRGSSCPCF